VAFLAARLRAAAAHITELRAQRERDVATIARYRAEAGALSDADDELARAQAALDDAQAALTTLRAERDLARQQCATAQGQRHASLAGLAHDLRNPLAPLSNGIELLRLTDADPAGRLRTRAIMERQVGNLMRIADQLSDLARLAGDQAQLQNLTIDLGDLLRHLPDKLGPVLETQQLSLVVGPELQGQLPLHGDAQRLEQAFAYLVDDVARHSERGTALQLSGVAGERSVALQLAAEVDLDTAGAQDGAELETVDASCLGLGVALADQLLRMHGGQLVARRRAGVRRVRFTATLPLAAGRAPGSALTGSAGTAVAAPAPAADSALSVLLADDNIDFSQSFGTMLELLGHRVALVHDGLAAVAAIVGSPPDVAFIDIGMPSLDGVEAVRRVRGQGNTQDVLLVAVTGRGGAEDRVRAAQAGFDRYLVKPFAMQDVREALEAAQAIRGRSPATARVARTADAPRA